MSEQQTILIIEDHEAIRKLLMGILNQEFKVVAKQNGVEGMAYLASGNLPDLILADMNMPGMNGIEFIQNLKCSGFYKNIPVFFVTGNDDFDTQKLCLEAGAKQVFGKPFKPSLLREKIRKQLLLEKTPVQ